MEKNGGSVVFAGLLLLLLVGFGYNNMSCKDLSERGPFAPGRTGPEEAVGEPEVEPEKAAEPEEKPVEKPVAEPEKAPDKGAAQIELPAIEEEDVGVAEEGADASEDGDVGEDITGKDGDLSILEAVMATSVEDRKAKGVGTRFDTGVGRLVAYVAIKNKGEPTTIKMVWKRAGKENFAIDVKVGNSKAWRTWSRKQMRAKDAGKWTVDVIGPEGGVLKTLSFELTAALDRSGGAGDDGGTGSGR